MKASEFYAEYVLDGKNSLCGLKSFEVQTNRNVGTKENKRRKNEEETEGDAETSCIAEDEIDLHKLPENLTQDKIDEILKQADEMHVECLNSTSIKRLVLQFEKRVKRNQEDRIKFADDPDKWMKSEVDLDEEIKKVKQIAAYPDLYDVFVDFGGVALLVSLLSHSNTDIQIEVLNVLVDLTDPDVLVDTKNPHKFIDALLNSQLAELAVDTILRINEDASEEDYGAVSDAFQLIENLADLQPENVSNKFQKVPKFIPWLLKRVRQSQRVDYNRIYASEILGIILQNSAECREWLGKKGGMDGIDKLLRSIAVYRKKNPEGINEEELVQNLFACLCNLMMVNAHKVTFGKAQGLELMIRMMREQNFSAKLALKLTNYATNLCPENCHLFVEKLGLKPLFSIFMGKTLLSKKGSKNETDDEEHAAAIIHSLCRHCTGIPLARVLNKFAENRFEKIERLMELHEKFQQKIRKLSFEKKAKNEVELLDKELEIDEEEQRFLEECENGLFALQQIDMIILRLPNMGNLTICQRLFQMLQIKGLQQTEIIKNVQDYKYHLDTSAEDEKKAVDLLLDNFQQLANEIELQ